MNFSVIICTYQRPESLRVLLKSIQSQTIKPNDLIIVDGSLDNKTEVLLKTEFDDFLELNYILVDSDQRGLTKQRNIGIKRVNAQSEVVVFLDDDLILEADFLLNLLSTFEDEKVIGADGLITNENYWIKSQPNEVHKLNYKYLDGYKLKLSSRDIIRKIFGSYPTNIQPGLIPKYGHGKSSLPPTGKSYFVEHIMGGITAYRVKLFEKIGFSEFFEGYGLYEDFDFSVRASRYGVLVTNTAARCEHHHAASGRPNTYKYGKMVVWNGYYVWRLKHPKLDFWNIQKWWFITFLLVSLRLMNAIGGPNRKESLFEAVGRLHSLGRLIFSKPI